MFLYILININILFCFQCMSLLHKGNVKFIQERSSIVFILVLKRLIGSLCQ